MFTVYRPIYSNRKTQGFGENKACVTASFPPRVIEKTGALCPQGFADFYLRNGMQGHNGEDWACWYGEPVYFPVVADTEWYALDGSDMQGGIGVDVISLNPVIDGQYVKFRFWHFRQEVVDDDQRIKAGDLLGYANSTGASSANHLHWSMKFCDEKGETLHKENGFCGAVNFARWFDNRFVLDALGIPYAFTLSERLAALRVSLRI